MSLLSDFAHNIDAKWITVQNNFTASRKTKLKVDTTTQSVVINLPASPYDGDFVQLRPVANSYNSNILNVNGGTKNVQGVSGNYGIDVNGVDVTLVFDSASDEWKIYHNGNLANGALSGGPYQGGPTTIATTPLWKIVSNASPAADKQLGHGSQVVADTASAALTLTLPSSPTDGEEVFVSPAGNTYATNNLTFARNGSLIQGAASDLVISTNGISVRLIYTGATNGWIPHTVMTIGA